VVGQVGVDRGEVFARFEFVGERIFDGRHIVGHDVEEVAGSASEGYAGYAEQVD